METKYIIKTETGSWETTDHTQALQWQQQTGGELKTIEYEPGAKDAVLYIDKANALHNSLFEQYYRERNYLSIGEIGLYVNHPVFGFEATALMQWWWQTCDLVAAHCATITGLTSLDPQTFINNLPPFTY